VGDNATAENSVSSVRGLQIDMLNGVKVDGQSFPSWDTDLPLEPFEQVQLLKGLSGFTYGFGSPGGIVNYVVKRPTDTPYRSISVGYLSAGVFSEKVDLGGRFGNDDRFGYRLNLVNENGNTAEANGHLRRQVASVAFDFRITPDLVWSADAFYQKRKTNGTLFGMYFGSGVGIPDASTVTHNLTQPQNYYETEMASFGTGLDYRINDNWHASLKYRFGKENRYNSDSLLYIFNNTGDYSNTLYAALTRYFYSNVDATVEGTFSTGSVKHDVVVGAGYQTQTSVYDNSVGWNEGYSLGTGNLYSSTLLTNDEVHIGEDLYRHSYTSQNALYASDIVNVTSRLSVLLGLRYTQFRQTTYNADYTVGAGYSANPVTPTVAVMFKTDSYSTLYASYVESLEQGGAASNLNVNYGQTFGPLRSKQYEVGFKTDRRKWGANFALFRVDQGYEYTNAQNVFVQNGTKRYTGLDASGWVQLANDWRLLGGVMWLNAKAVDIDDPAIDGKRVYATPHFTATGRVEYNPSYMPELTLAFGGTYVGNMPVDAANTQFTPAYVLYDLSGKYETRISGKDVTFRSTAATGLPRTATMCCRARRERPLPARPCISDRVALPTKKLDRSSVRAFCFRRRSPRYRDALPSAAGAGIIATLQNQLSAARSRVCHSARFSSTLLHRTGGVRSCVVAVHCCAARENACEPSALGLPAVARPASSGLTRSSSRAGLRICWRISSIRFAYQSARHATSVQCASRHAHLLSLSLR
jgi:iron complex outermembrane receptor protein